MTDQPRQRAKEYFADGAEFSMLLTVAADRATAADDVTFVDNVRKRRDFYGMDAYLEEPQYARLKQIAGVP